MVDAGNLPDGELFYCPALDAEKGCMLGVDKPFDCFYMAVQNYVR